MEEITTPEVDAPEGDVITDEAPVEATTEVTDDTEAPAEPEPEVAHRGRGGLELEVKAVTDDFATGDVALEDGELLTPHRIATLIGTRTGKKPSTGAVAATLARWYEIGYIVKNDKPLAFLDYTDAARTDGLAALKAVSVDRRKAERAAADGAAVAAEPEPSV